MCLYLSSIGQVYPKEEDLNDPSISKSEHVYSSPRGGQSSA